MLPVGDVTISFKAVDDEPELVPCPENASGAPVCVCNVGFDGNLTFDQEEGWSGTCVVIEEVDNGANNETESDLPETNLTEEDLDEIEDGEVPGFGFIAVLVSLLAISRIRRK